MLEFPPEMFNDLEFSDQIGQGGASDSDEADRKKSAPTKGERSKDEVLQVLRLVGLGEGRELHAILARRDTQAGRLSRGAQTLRHTRRTDFLQRSDAIVFQVLLH